MFLNFLKKDEGVEDHMERMKNKKFAEEGQTYIPQGKKVKVQIEKQGRMLIGTGKKNQNYNQQCSCIVKGFKLN